MPLFIVPGSVNGISSMRTTLGIGGCRLSGSPDYLGSNGLISLQSYSMNAAVSGGSDGICRREDSEVWMSQASLAANKLSDEHGDKSSKSMELCADPQSEKFVAHILTIRDQAVSLAQARKAELLLWNEGAKKRTRLWFNSDDNELKQYLQQGLDATIRVLQGLNAKSFLKNSPENSQLTGCSPEINSDAKAAVCQTDTTEHRILIALGFCELDIDKKQHNSNVIRHGDSQLLTLVHEVLHFNDVFKSLDHWYGTRSALRYAGDSRSRNTTDNLAAYIVGVSND